MSSGRGVHLEFRPRRWGKTERLRERMREMEEGTMMLNELWVIIDREGCVTATDGARPLTEHEAKQEAAWLDQANPTRRPHEVRRYTLSPAETLSEQLSRVSVGR